ncbi:MAG TPA: LPS export ABC transporter permease LptF [Xanthobacteraceae bacterium]|jgi:lipopolysaccharide export system permease protein|nr:LPS export ABC transporter permease LptF [Xanthobacteraceae bacterium]
MGSIGRYMFRATMSAFLITLVSLTVMTWFTQAMREFDLITSQRQTLLVFVGITGLIIPLLVMMIAPIALVMASAHVLNKLSSDSEIIVMNAAGISPWRLLRPFIIAAVMVSVLLTVIAAYVSPRSLRALRDWSAQVRADILTNIVQPGRFTTVGGNLTFHIADRRQDGLLVGIFVDDRRDPKEHSTYLAEQGEIVKNDSGSFLVFQAGSIQRLEAGQRDPRIVIFDRYAFDLSQFTGGARNVVYTVRERYLWDLLWPKADDPLYVAQPDQYLSELHDRLSTPLYPIAFVIVAFAFLGPPQTTRQSRSLALMGMITIVATLRLLGFVSVIVGVHVPSVLALQYVALFGAIGGGLWQIGRGRAVEPAAAMSKLATAVTDRIAKATS